MILAAREGPNKILKAGVLMSVEYFTVFQDVKSQKNLFSHPSVARRAEKGCFVVLTLERYLSLIYIACLGFCFLPDLWGGPCGGGIIFQ